MEAGSVRMDLAPYRIRRARSRIVPRGRAFLHPITGSSRGPSGAVVPQLGYSGAHVRKRCVAILFGRKRPRLARAVPGRRRLKTPPPAIARQCLFQPSRAPHHRRKHVLGEPFSEQLLAAKHGLALKAPHGHVQPDAVARKRQVGRAVGNTGYAPCARSSRNSDIDRPPGSTEPTG